MKFFLISDNKDTYIGMRLAGIEGVVVQEPHEVEAALKRASEDPEIAIVLITARISKLCHETVYNIKLSTSRPLIIEVEDRHLDGKLSESITQYVRDAVGIKI